MREDDVPRCYCYLLECADGSYYTGWTTEPRRRVREHNQGQGARYTRSRLPVTLRYLEEQEDQSSAMSREYQIKQLSHEEKAALARSWEDGNKQGN